MVRIGVGDMKRPFWRMYLRKFCEEKQLSDAQHLFNIRRVLILLELYHEPNQSKEIQPIEPTFQNTEKFLDPKLPSIYYFLNHQLCQSSA